MPCGGRWDLEHSQILPPSCKMFPVALYINESFSSLLGSATSCFKICQCLSSMSSFHITRCPRESGLWSDHSPCLHTQGALGAFTTRPASQHPRQPSCLCGGFEKVRQGGIPRSNHFYHLNAQSLYIRVLL